MPDTGSAALEFARTAEQFREAQAKRRKLAELVRPIVERAAVNHFAEGIAAAIQGKRTT